MDTSAYDHGNGDGSLGAETVSPNGGMHGLRIPRSLRNLALVTAQARRRKDTAAQAAHGAALEARDARVAYEAEQFRLDPNGKRTASLLVAGLLAALFAVLDVLPAWWAAEALGGGFWATGVVTLLFVAGLAGFAALMSFFRHEGDSKGFTASLALAIGLVVTETALRLDYLIVTSSAGLFRSIIEVAVLAIVTSGLMWFSFVVLLGAEPKVLYDLRRELTQLDEEAAALAAYADGSKENWKLQAAALGLVTSGTDNTELLDRKVRGELGAAGEPQ